MTSEDNSSSQELEMSSIKKNKPTHQSPKEPKNRSGFRVP